MHCKLIVLLACLLGAALGEYSPVFSWGSISPSRPAMYSISEDSFIEMMQPKAKDNMIVVFMGPGLSNSDFSCSKSSTGETCFSNLADAPLKNFYTSVENPVGALRAISETRESAIVDENGNLADDVACQPGKAVFIDLGIPTESSTLSIQHNELLQKHDDMMSKCYKNLAEKCKIIAFYTSTPSTTNVSKSRSRRAADSATSGNMFRSNKDFLIFFTDLMMREEKPDKKWEETPITIAGMTITGKNETAFTVNLDGGSHKLSFLISSAFGYFKVSHLMLNNEEYYVPAEVTSPTDFSYTCGNQTFINKYDPENKEKPNRVIVWNSLQMQAPFNEATPNDFKFGDSWDCVGFFSSGILAGLFVVFILLGIMSVGICWMLDINTMDRFDDPKGKTITINVNE